MIKWIKGWASILGRELEVLEPSGWFEQGHDHYGVEMNVGGVCIPKFKAGTFVWGSSPAVARIVIEDLRQSRQKQTQSADMLGVPILLWRNWRRHIYKSADLIVEIPAGCVEIWPVEMHETLMFFIYFPHINRFPWELRKTNLLV